MQSVIPNIWFQGDAEEAGVFYASAFSFADASSAIESRYPHEGLLEFQRDFAGEPLTVSLTVADFRFTLINAGSEFAPNPSISFMLNFDPLFFGTGSGSAEDAAAAKAALDELWVTLCEGGKILMPLGSYPFSGHFGWVEDRFGVSWQLVLTNPAGDPRPFVVPALLFTGAAQNRAGEAVDRYVSIFADAKMGSRVPYAVQSGPATPGAVMFSDFRIGDQWFAAMDGSADHSFGFGSGVSLEVLCRDQAEIDKLWDALSAVPEAEQCGWLKDEFGVSWQIVPRNMGELMERPGAFARMLEMKKLVIAEL